MVFVQREEQTRAEWQRRLDESILASREKSARSDRSLQQRIEEINSQWELKMRQKEVRRDGGSLVVLVEPSCSCALGFPNEAVGVGLEFRCPWTISRGLCEEDGESWLDDLD